jgi:cell wall-associated NlpC family hydrolase
MMIQLKPADLLFVKPRTADVDDFSNAIAKSTGAYVHVALFAGENKIIHATSEHGVVTQTLTDFLAENQQVTVFRLPNIDSQAVISEASQHLGQPYNFSFYPESEGFYCSQLVATAFANQIKFPEVAMAFGDGEKEISDYWQAYFDQLGVAVPLGQLGTNPDDLSKFSALALVGTLSDAH